MSQVAIIDIANSNPQVPTSFTTDDGTAIPIANNLEILGTSVPAGTTPVETTGSGKTVTIEVQTAQSSPTSDASLIGLASFDSDSFDVDANGFVTLNGGGIAATSFDVQASTPPGTDPVVPSGAGVITVNGAVVANHSVVLETRSRAANEYNLEIQTATTAAVTDATKSGVAHFDSASFSVDVNGFVTLAGGGQAIDSITPNSGIQVVPDGTGNVSILGAGSITTVGTLNTETIELTGLTDHSVLLGAGTSTITSLTNGTTGQVLTANTGADPTWEDNSSTDYHTARWIVSAGGAADGANYTTIASAYAAALAEGGVQTVFVQPGSYSEDLTLQPNINLTAFVGDDDTPTVTLIGKQTFTQAGRVSISNIRLQTDGDYFLAVTGSAASIVHLNNCYLNCADNVGMNLTSSSSSSAIYANASTFVTANPMFTHTGSGALQLSYCTHLGAGNSTPSTISSGSFLAEFCLIRNPITTSGTASFFAMHCRFSDAIGTKMLIMGGSGLHRIYQCNIASGAATTITVTSTLLIHDAVIECTNASVDAIDGAGSITYSGLVFSGLSSTITTSTQTVKSEGPSRTIGSLNSGGTNTLAVTNTANAASSNALQQVTVGGTSAGDPLTTYTVTNGSSWSAGVDNSASDTYVVAASTALGTSNALSITTAGVSTWTGNILAPGISFDSGTNVLSTYTEGTYTPTMVGQSVAGTTTYVIQNGYYTRIGNLVTVTASLTGTAATGTGNVNFTSLPFTVKNVSNGSSRGSIFSASNATWVFPGTSTMLTFIAENNTTRGTVYGSGSATSGGFYQMANATFNFGYTATYQI